MNFRRAFLLGLPVVLGGLAAVWCPGAGAQTAPAKTTCLVDPRKPSEADVALRERRFADAEALYGKDLAVAPNSAEAMAGLVRTKLAEGKLTEALAMATKDDTAHPNTPSLLDALGEVRFRRGEVNEAANAFNASMHADPCAGTTQYDMSRFFRLNGMYATAQRRLDMAHALAPQNQEIWGHWQWSHEVPTSSASRLSQLKEALKDTTLTPEKKEGIEAAIKGIEVSEKGDCRLATPMTEAKFPLVPITYGASYLPQDLYAVGLDIQLNGKRKRLELDSGASGLLITKAAAKSVGLVPEVETREGGIGDHGPAHAFVTHVDDIKIGGMEFKNCMVGVLEQGSEAIDNADGLIGPDVFRDYVVTLDIPGREVRLGPLPKRPDEAAMETTSLNTSKDDGPLQSIAERAKDRYVAPEMKDWTPVFRSDHFLIFPTLIGNAPVKLFIMDTGASSGMITPAAAREVTHVSGDGGRIEGISGEVNKVLLAGTVKIQFAKVSQMTLGMTSYDNAFLSDSSGVEISGLIGFPTLRELVISIDYRDNLVHVVYDPSKGYHLH